MGKKRLAVGQRWKVLSHEEDPDDGYWVMRVVGQISDDRFVFVDDNVPTDEVGIAHLEVFTTDGEEAGNPALFAGFYLVRKLKDSKRRG